MSPEPSAKPTIRERVRHELREYAQVSIYLLICFSAILFYKAAILHEHGVDAWRFGAAVGKSLILGKFVLIGQAMRIGERRESATLARGILVKSFLFLLLLVALSLLEELVTSMIHHRPFAASLAERGSVRELVASSVVMLLILIPYVAFMELDDAMGDGKLRRLMFGRRPPE